LCSSQHQPCLIEDVKATPPIEDVNDELYDLLVASGGQFKISNWIGIISKSKLPMILLLPQQKKFAIDTFGLAEKHM